MIHALSIALFDDSKALPDFPVRKDIRGIGMSDWDGYAMPLSKKLDYTNTFYHQAPRLDITDIAETDRRHLDFILSTDVFEHIAPPITRAFENVSELLKPDGVFVVSVPYTLDDRTVEHFPELHDYKIEYRATDRVLVNNTKDGRMQEFANLVFHGGEGETLEMRVFAETDLLKNLKDAGFDDVQIMREPCFDFGIWWSHLCSLPIIARKQPRGFRILAWGPTVTRRNVPINLQPNGDSAIWIRLDRSAAADRIGLEIGDAALSDIGVSHDLITGVIPPEVLMCVGAYPVRLVDKVSHQRVLVGHFSVFD